jgi:lipopolysaccharide/colanic/teichoic acid biosynthesis glycosyltransferase
MTTFDARRKRALDVVVATFALGALAPLLLVLALAVRLSSPGPILYRQVRIGQGGRPFRVIKFRTMVHVPGVDIDPITTADDPRITPMGRLLRRFKLDELPQLVNVLRGEMSLVGPRPDVPGYADRLDAGSRRVLDVRPGITGPATLAFREEEELLARIPDHRLYNDEVIYPLKTRINLEYLDRWSMRRDLGYLVITVAPVADRWLRLMPQVEPMPEGARGSNGTNGTGRPATTAERRER